MRPQSTAAILSAIVPGLGQFYNRQWAKGLAFLVAVSIVDLALGVSADTMQVVLTALGQGGTGDSASQPVDPLSLMLRSLPVLGIVAWSMIDAARTAARTPPGPR